MDPRHLLLDEWISSDLQLLFVLLDNKLTFKNELVCLRIKIHDSVVLEEKLDELLSDLDAGRLLNYSHQGEEIEDWAFLKDFQCHFTVVFALISKDV